METIKFLSMNFVDQTFRATINEVELNSVLKLTI